MIAIDEVLPDLVQADAHDTGIGATGVQRDKVASFCCPYVGGRPSPSKHGSQYDSVVATVIEKQLAT